MVAVTVGAGCVGLLWRHLRGATLRQPPTSPDAAHWRHQALHDDLTHLANRGGLFESLELLINPTSEDGRPCAVLYADLDCFKGINDTYGHAAGDELLVAVADRLRGLVRPGDTVARLGGDEFVLVLDRVGEVAGALEIAERVRHALAAPVRIGGRPMTVTASFGIAVGGEHTASALLDQADVALYEAKRSGRNRSVVWTPAMGLPITSTFTRRRRSYP